MAGAPAAAVKAQFPRQGYGGAVKRPEQVLLLCWYDPAGISTVPETVSFMQAVSAFSVTVLNLFEHRADSGNLRLHPWVRLDAFDAVVIHNSVSYSVDNLRSLDRGLDVPLKAFRGVKVLLKQDENYRFRELAGYIGEVGFDAVFTCLPPEAVSLVYPPSVVGPVRFERMLTGYVTPTLRAHRPAAGGRPIDIGYRGSIQPLSFGRLAYEKRKIGEDVLRLLQGRGLALDISSRWEDRLGGDAWFEFLRSCKATLGAESGASIFDLAGDLDARCAALEEQYKHLPTDAQRTEAALAQLQDLESNVRYHQVSPRHFEAAACGAVQLLYPGDYSGLLVAGRHYFELARDYANLEEAVAFVMDEPRRAAMAACAFEEVVMNPANWIEGFVQRVDHCLREALEARGVLRRPLAAAPAGSNVLLLASHDPVIDPRLGWIEEAAPAPLRVHQLGVLREVSLPPKSETTARGNLLMGVPRQPGAPDFWDRYAGAVSHSPAATAALHEMQAMARAVQLPDLAFARLFGAPPAAARNVPFRWYLQYLQDITATLVQAAAHCAGIHAIIATDLDALPAALILKGLLGVPVVYDAHEYWPETDPQFLEYERQFWHGLERRLVPHADARQTVSPGLARVMAEEYGVPFDAVPNCEPADRLLPARERAARADCQFLFQGNFAPGRGLDLLILAWASTDARAVLQLRGPENAYKQKMLELASQTGLLGTRILFPEPVSEDELVASAADADVGLIPYTPAGTAYRHCCPNKMSQYMAAGLPVLANRTEFVAETIRRADCGLVVDFTDRRGLVEAVNRFCADAGQRQAWGRRARDFFAGRFNWNLVSQPLYDRLQALAGARPHEAFEAFRADPRPFLDLTQEERDRPVPIPIRPLLAQLVPAVWRRLPAFVRVPVRPVARGLRRLLTPNSR